ncbi:MAG: hypothetical protein EBR88_02600 [Betaproteobacteria bacterium]|nr:hypothetical protein [Betaproteobacteria bacterium]
MYLPRHQKTYLSRAQTRAMGLEHPIGDPHGGPAYGERNDPVSAVISVLTMTGTYAAAGSFAAMTVLQGVAFAGAAISLVGNVTGNKTLSKIGMVAGLAGGIGALAESAGMFSSGTLGETFGIGSAAPGAGAGAAPGAELVQTPTVTAPAMDVQSSVPQTNPMDTVASQGLINNANQTLNTTPLSEVKGSPFYGTTTDFTSQQIAPPAAAQAPVAAQPPAGAPAAPAAPAIGAPTAPAIPGARPDLLQSAGVLAPGQASVVAGNATQPGFFDSLKTGNYMDAAKAAGSGIMDLAKNNPGAAYMLGQAAVGVGDVLSGKTAAQIAQMEASGELSKAQADKIRYEIELNEKRRRQLNQNMAMPLNFSINPNAVTFNQPGLINSARGG